MRRPERRAEDRRSIAARGPSLGPSIELALDADAQVVTWTPAFDEILAGPYALTLTGDTLEATVYVQTVVDHFASPSLGRQAGRPCPL